MNVSCPVGQAWRTKGNHQWFSSGGSDGEIQGTGPPSSCVGVSLQDWPRRFCFQSVFIYVCFAVPHNTQNLSSHQGSSQPLPSGRTDAQTPDPGKRLPESHFLGLFCGLLPVWIGLTWAAFLDIVATTECDSPDRSAKAKWLWFPVDRILWGRGVAMLCGHIVSLWRGSQPTLHHQRARPGTEPHGSGLISAGHARTPKLWPASSVRLDGASQEAGKEPTCECSRRKRPEFPPWVGSRGGDGHHPSVPARITLWTEEPRNPETLHSFTPKP